MQRVGLLTTGRQDWGILRSTAVALRDDPRFDLRLIVGGMHCSDAFGRTERLVTADGFAPAERLDWIVDGAEASEDAAEALAAVAGALDRQDVEGLVLAGDRFETAAAALAATITGTALIHLHGGEETAGAIDNALRHAITKMSHLHLVSHPDHAARVVATGEAQDTVRVVGAPGLDNLFREDLATKKELEGELGLSLKPPVVVVTLQPITLDGESASAREAHAVAAAIEEVPATYVITLPNDDPGHETTRSVMAEAGAKPGRVAVLALGERRYWGLLRVADAVLGNSSSGLIEAPALQLPAVNVGDRQGGRLRGSNVIDVSGSASAAIANALRLALSPATRALLAGTTSPYGDGRSAGRIIEILASWQPPSPLRKAAVAIPASVR